MSSAAVLSRPSPPTEVAREKRWLDERTIRHAERARPQRALVRLGERREAGAAAADLVALVESKGTEPEVQLLHELLRSRAAVSQSRDLAFRGTGNERIAILTPEDITVLPPDPAETGGLDSWDF